jgi:protein-S-isoprenylcysteine O-methyltransferase Ste14
VSRGTPWVVVQFALIAAVAVSWLAPPRVESTALHAIGLALVAAGVGLFIWAYRALGRSFTPFPRPRDDAELVTHGPFALVRHPIYLGGILFFAGVSLGFSWTALALTGALTILWMLKLRVEERHLAARFPAYAEYVRRVRYRLLPLLY